MIPVNIPLLDGNEKKYVEHCIETGWISSEGPYVQEFEEKLSAQVGRRYGIAVSNGSAALDIAVCALGIGKGDEVIMPTFTIISCAAAIVRAGAIPVLVDADPITWNIDVNRIEEKITQKTCAIMVVHIYGIPTNMNPVLEIAKKHGLKIIEDAAEMHGQTYMGKQCGSFGDISTFSFYPNKHITTGEGGMVVCNDLELAERCRSLRNLCFQKKKRFIHEELGWNFRLTNIQAGLGLAQLEQLEKFVVKKRAMGNIYNNLLSDINVIQKPLVKTSYADNIYWVYGVVLIDEFQHDADEVMKRLGDRGIGTRPFFWPMHEQPVFRKMGLFSNEKHPVSERIARRGFYIPSGLGLTNEQMEEVGKVMHEVLCSKFE